ncbi:MAG: protein jag [Clostridiales bacterium]|nr:protein jag [Clostridiales bacterium]
MKQELIATGRTVEAAVSNGAAELGVEVERITYEVLEAPKKGFLGFGEAPAKVKITFTPRPEDTALEFVRMLLRDMELDAEAELARELTSAGDRLIRISGESAGVLIGRHGDTLDALQSLVNLVANRAEKEGDDSRYTKISVDIENYRVKREETLRRLARAKASQVRKTRKNITLEPMNPYERRIIHSEIQNINGVSTTSVGSDSNRRVIIWLEENGKPTAAKKSELDDGFGESDRAPRESSSSKRRRRRKRPQSGSKPAADTNADPGFETDSRDSADSSAAGTNHNSTEPIEKSFD